ncbi:hypothetical protein EJ05DRAFT_18356 [Pseudovirgaria hyperparasitica]|uniref:Uncharacterized protein n=1 Tax=Pseudovirgaria hyperparasitica TaxID=470096 RepID=A0A6A6WL21_9PEZI|nr:uncharacterized protein EJ05DRAFT_18356 [Pseudovirgaria hyperparasitica]KAF2762877.1 hypothetical protein EJ05DRAFT_18356 [Pseudovirgaria hyperparasitica]
MSHLRGAMSLIEATKNDGTSEAFNPLILAVMMIHLILAWIVNPLPHALQMHAAMKNFSLTAGPLLRLPTFFARLTQLGVTTAEVHTELRSYRATQWAGVTDEKLARLYSKCCRLACRLSKAIPQNYCVDETCPVESEPLKFNDTWDNPNQRDWSIWGRRDFSTVCLYRIIVCVASRRCIARMMDAMSFDDPNAIYHMIALEDADNKVKNLLSLACQDIFDMVPHFFDASCPPSPIPKDAGSGDDNMAFWGVQKPKIGAYLLMMPLRAIMSIPELPQETYDKVVSIAVQLSQGTGIDLEYIMVRLCGNLFEEDARTNCFFT